MANRGAQNVDQFRVHELILVGNVEDVGGLAGDCIWIVGQQARAVFLFHGEDYVGTLDVGCGDTTAGARTRAGGADLKRRMIPPHALCGRAAPLVPAANEEHVHFECTVASFG